MDGFDYSAPGSYFITICTSNRECLLGNVVVVKMRSIDVVRFDGEDRVC